MPLGLDGMLPVRSDPTPFLQLSGDGFERSQQAIRFDPHRVQGTINYYDGEGDPPPIRVNLANLSRESMELALREGRSGRDAMLAAARSIPQLDEGDQMQGQDIRRMSPAQRAQVLPEEAHWQPTHQEPPPMVMTVFEVEGFGKMRAGYHEVITGPHFIVLVLNTQHGHASQFWPSPTITGDLAFTEENGDTVYLVQPTGIDYEWNGFRHCILNILDSSAK